MNISKELSLKSPEIIYLLIINLLAAIFKNNLFSFPNGFFIKIKFTEFYFAKFI